ncbi:hypothetical protein ACI76O_10790 [Capnocytophaga cynodegmi]|uniref:hypothetical protein n=1 Tax=Capnocytophaga cynodegmi TaxID=28189 RepID=UPI00385F24A3
MYRGFNLKLDKRIFDNNSEIRYYSRKELKFKEEQEDDNKGFERLEKVLEGTEILDGNQIMKDWFPIEGKYHIFLSHSHRDLELAYAIAGKLREKHNLNVFIDSLVWGYCDDLLEKIDKKYCRGTIEGLYDYKKRNYSTSHIHMMLMNSLNQMIDRCEALFFLNTPNSVSIKDISDESKTASPWIFSEIMMSQLIRKKTPKRLLKHTRLFSEESLNYTTLNESTSPELNIKYQLELNHLSELSNDEFSEWIASDYDTPEEALNSLYLLNPLENIEIVNFN